MQPHREVGAQQIYDLRLRRPGAQAAPPMDVLFLGDVEVASVRDPALQKLFAVFRFKRRAIFRLRANTIKHRPDD